MTIELAGKRKKRFTDFATEPSVLDGDKVKLDAILNQEIEIIGYRIGDSNYSKNKSGKYLTLQIRIDREVKIIFTGSDVLIKQVEKYENEIPYLAIIKKINRYYTLS